VPVKREAGFFLKDTNVQRKQAITILCVRATSLAALALVALVGFQLGPPEGSTLAEEPAGLRATAATAVSDSVATTHPLDAALQRAQVGLDHLRSHIRDYQALLIKRERIGGQLSEQQFLEILVRCRREEAGQVVQPLSVYLHFLQPDSVKGREVIWVQGRNDNKLVAHEGGFKNLLRVHLRPDSTLAMWGQRYPITQIGIENLIVQLIRKGERDRRYEECEVRFFREAKVDGRLCTKIEVVHPHRRAHFDFHRAEIFIDEQSQVPIRYAAWSWPAAPGGQPLLEEEYTYTNLQLNVGLTDQHFDPDNPDYNFP
jgi:hypothetical protein